MANETQKDPRKQFAPLILPWLMGAVMLAIYWFTLNRWINLLNLGQVATVSGLVWQPQLFGPLTYLATLPFHWLSPAKVPVALNLFSAVCGALTLVLLARSVALLPQDRTEPQRQRERSDFAFLTGWPAYFPPVVAVLFAGLQLSFWQHSTNFTGETLDLLLFAAIIWQLLEYRLDERPWRMTAAMLAYGAGIAENWMFVAFFPLLLMMIIWLKRLEFFSIRFLVRAVLCGLAGMLFFLLLPLQAKFSGNFQIGLWEALRPAIRTDWQVVKALKISGIRHNLLMASLSTLLPVLLMTLRWSSSFGDNSRIGTALSSTMFHFMSAAVFTVCVWGMFDPPFGAGVATGMPGLTLYYFAALSIGYSCGYFLLVFGKKPVPTRRDPKPLPLLPKNLMWLCPVVVAGTFLAAAITLGTLVYRNAPIIRETNGDTLLKFAQFTTQNLPKGGAFLLVDSDNPLQNQPFRSLILQAALEREGRAADFPVLDTQSLNWAPYHRYLHDRYPKKWPLTVKPTDMGAVSPLGNFELLNSLARSNTLCYLNPSYGYYFEKFYQEPHGLVYVMKLRSEETLLPPPLDKNRVAENEKFWSHVVETVRPGIKTALKKPDPIVHKNFPQWLIMRLHALPTASAEAIFTGMFYSRSLNDWGVQLQRAGELDPAAARFTAAKELNPDNVIADINLAFNQTLRAGTPMEVDLSHVNADQFGKYRNWNSVLNANGPFDEISFNFTTGFQFMQNGLFRQAAQEFTRVRQLVPDNLDARLELAQIYLFNHLPDRALEALHDPLTRPVRFGLNENNSTGLNILAAAIHFQKNEADDGGRLLDLEVARHPDDDTLRTAATQAYFMRGLYTNALRIINGKLARSPDDLQWLFGKGYACIQTGDFESAIAAMTRVLTIQTNDAAARFNRALAYLNVGQLDSARADYGQLQTTYTNAYQVAYGLGDIAARQHHTNEAVRNFKLYLANAPTNTPEFKTVRERLEQLRGP